MSPATAWATSPSPCHCTHCVAVHLTVARTTLPCLSQLPVPPTSLSSSQLPTPPTLSRPPPQLWQQHPKYMTTTTATQHDTTTTTTALPRDQCDITHLRHDCHDHHNVAQPQRDCCDHCNVTHDHCDVSTIALHDCIMSAITSHDCDNHCQFSEFRIPEHIMSSIPKSPNLVIKSGLSNFVLSNRVP